MKLDKDLENMLNRIYQEGSGQPQKHLESYWYWKGWKDHKHLSKGVALLMLLVGTINGILWMVIIQLLF